VCVCVCVCVCVAAYLDALARLLDLYRRANLKKRAKYREGLARILDPDTGVERDEIVALYPPAHASKFINSLEMKRKPFSCEPSYLPRGLLVADFLPPRNQCGKI